jgi:hypothetical protein
MPGGYWVLGLFFINLFLGGIVRARKGWKKTGVLISHSGILLMILSAGVTEMTEERGTMDFFEGESSNVAQDYYEYVVEISERTAGMPKEVHVVRGENLTDLHGNLAPVRTVRLLELPFDTADRCLTPNEHDRIAALSGWCCRPGTPDPRRRFPEASPRSNSPSGASWCSVRG